VSDVENLRTTGSRIQSILEQFEGLPECRPLEWAEELVRLLTSMYGEGLTRIIEIASQDEAPRGDAFVRRLCDDRLLSSLLLLHELHPDDVRQRVERALHDVGSSLGAGDAHLLELDEQDASVKIRLLSGSSSVQAASETLVRRAIEDAAPEIENVIIDRPLPRTQVQITRKPLAEAVESAR